MGERLIAPNIAVYTPTRNPGIAVTYSSILRQDIEINHWLVADQLSVERDIVWRAMRSSSIHNRINIETFNSEISEGKVSNLAHVSNWALNRARELEVDLLVFLQDFIWIPDNGVRSFYELSELYPFDFYTGYMYASEGPKIGRMRKDNLYSVFNHLNESIDKPPEPYTLDTRDGVLSMDKNVHTLTNHAWEVNWGAMPYSIINAGVDFDEDYDYGTQWENTQFCFDVNRKTGSGVKWDYRNRAVSMPHRDYFPKTHEGERDYDNGHRFWKKNPDLKNSA